jgi:hypothetical protein
VRRFGDNGDSIVFGNSVVQPAHRLGGPWWNFLRGDTRIAVACFPDATGHGGRTGSGDRQQRRYKRQGHKKAEKVQAHFETPSVPVVLFCDHELTVSAGQAKVS